MGKRKKHSNRSTPSTAVVDLTAAEVHRLAKPKEGFTAYVDPLVDLYLANRGEMPGFDAAAVRSETAAYEALTATIEQQRAQLELSIKTRALHASKAWRGTLQIYKWGILVGTNNATIRRGVARFAQYMKRGPRKRKVATTTTTTQPPHS